MQSVTLINTVADPASRKKMVSIPEVLNQKEELEYTLVSQADHDMRGAENMYEMQKSSRKEAASSSIG